MYFHRLAMCPHHEISFPNAHLKYDETNPFAWKKNIIWISSSWLLFNSFSTRWLERFNKAGVYLQQSHN